MSSKAKPHLMPEADRERFARASGADPKIFRQGGKFGAGMITGVSLATVGEALGHEYWLDETTLTQIVSRSRATGETGLKARFTHPGMSSDGMGRFLGRLFNVRLQNNKAVGDLHFAQSAKDTPDGDLAEYVMKLTEEDSRAAGLSIVFHHDFAAEEAFEAEHEEECEYEDYRGRKVKRMRFKSPDPRNTESYPHVRIAELRAADVVDEPAANPGGMFDTESLPRDADELLSYAAGISDTKPKASMFGVDGDRASQFLGRWLESHGLSLVPKEQAEMATENENNDAGTQVEQPAQPSRESFTAELNRFVERFGAENGAKWFGENKSFAEALELHCVELQSQLASATERADQAEERLASVQLGEDKPIDTKVEDSAKPKRTFAEATRRQA